MSKEIDRQEIAKRYLLGELPEEERTGIEERYFLDDEEFEQFEIAEDELIDRYVRDELSVEERRRFKELLVAPGFMERVEVAKLIAQRTASPVRQVAATPVTVPAQPVSVGLWDRLFGSPAAAVPEEFRRASGFADNAANTFNTKDAFNRLNLNADVTTYRHWKGEHSIKVGMQYERLGNSVNVGQQFLNISINWDRAFQPNVGGPP